MALDIRTITDREFAAWVDVKATTFFGEVPVAEGIDYRRSTADLDRSWAAFDGSQVVATLSSFPAEITVPGGAIVSADAVTSVTTRATHRRRGALKGMMTASLVSAVERGDAVSILIAARWPIYGRYGYGPSTDTATLTIDPRNATFAGAPLEGLSYVHAATARASAEQIFDRFRRGQVGAITRRPNTFDLDFALVKVPGYEEWKGYSVLHRGDDGEPDGYLRYHVIDKWDGLEPMSTLVVDDLIATTPRSYTSLWRLCLEVDNITRVRAEQRSVDETLRWLVSDGRAVAGSNVSDFLWLRVLDVAATLSARRYLTEGSIVIEVEDPMGHASGRWALDGGPDGATCVRTHASPDLSLTSTALGAVFLGGSRLGSIAASDQVAERTDGALAKADAMFAPAVTPWCNTMF